MRRCRTVLVALLLLMPATMQSALAQDGLFAPVVTVNKQVVTRYEVQQRVLFLKILRQPGDLTKMAMDGLIEDRLRQDAAKTLGVTVTADEVKAGMAEFAARANLSTEAFLKAVGQGGVEPETFRDFVSAGLVWRGVIRQRFGGRVHISDAEVDRAIAAGAASGGAVRLLLSEIVIPSSSPDALAIATRLKNSITTPTSFAIAAQNYSKADTAKGGGALNWIEATALPPEIAPRILALKPGEITDPIAVSGSIELFLLRDISQGAGDTKGVTEVDYARVTPSPGTDLARLRGRLDTCDDLNTVARGLPADSLQRQTVPESSVPGDIGAALTLLDAGETVIVTGTSGAAAVIMLCSRRPHSDVAVSRDDITTDLLNRKLGLLAVAYMEELRSDANIVQR